MTANLPSGTVTFLFTDIEASTKLAWEYGDTWEALRARHHAILKGTIETHKGYVFEIVGDASCAAFHTSGDALRAAIQAQMDFQAEEWGETPVRVRMGIHTGKAELQENGHYVGYMTLVHVQRLMTAGHGGQVLLSAAAEGLVHDELPEGVALRDLGESRLKDLSRAEHIYQIVTANLPEAFPPLRTLDVNHHNLPAQMTSFIGREREIAEIERSLGASRLVTLTGSGGTGKTRLALQVGAELLDRFPDGVWLVQLAYTAEAELVAQTVAAALGVAEVPAQAISDTLARFLKSKGLLLILDNCEHLIEPCARLAGNLLQGCPDLSILATSREQLRISGEITYQVPSLSVPDLQELPSAEELRQFEAVRMFVERGRLAKPSFELSVENARAVAQVCYHLDGMPLALELAAALLNVLTVEQILSRLGDRFHLLTRGSRAALDRQQTLRTTLDWSYNLLSEPEQHVFKRLAVFVGGCTLEAAEAVCAGHGIESSDVLPLLSQLVNKSLVTAEQVGGESRYRMLETIREYANERLSESGNAESDGTHARHFDYFLEFMEEIEPQLSGSEQSLWLTRVEAEHENIRAALEWSEVTFDDGNAGLRLAATMGSFWRRQGHNTEGRTRLAAALAHEGTHKPTIARARALYHASSLAFFQTDYKAAHALAEQSIEIAKELGAAGHLTVGDAQEILAEVASETGDYSSAVKLHQQALSTYREVGDLVGIGDTLKMLGWVAMRTGDYERAQSELEQGLLACRESGDLRQINSALAGLGELAVRRGQYERARDFLVESLDISRILGDRWEVAIDLGSLGWIALRQGAYQEMRKLLADSIALRVETGDRGGVAWCLERLADAASLQGQSEKAVRTLSAAAVLRSSLGSVIDPADQQDHNRILAGLNTALSEEVFSAAWEKGRALTMEQAIEFALD